MNNLEPGFIIAVEANNSTMYLRKHEYSNWNNKSIREWYLVYKKDRAFRFNSKKMAEHRARTSSEVKRYISNYGGKWLVYKVYADELVSSSLTDTPLHRLAKAAK
jgi:hypothetical protein